MADRYDWDWVLFATARFALLGLLLTVLFYRYAPASLTPGPKSETTTLRFGPDALLANG